MSTSISTTILRPQCLDGVEKGLADVDRCHYVQVAEDLYLFVWREKIIPTLG